MTQWQIGGFAGQGLCLSALVWAGLHDFAVRTVPNRLVALAGAGALLTAAAAGRLGSGLFVGAVFLAGCCVLWRQGWLGGGDAKLLATAAPLVPPAHAFDLLLSIALAGGVLALPYLPGRRLFPRPPAPREPTLRPHAMLSRLLRCERWRLSRRGPLPYAAAIAAGTVLVAFRGK